MSEEQQARQVRAGFLYGFIAYSSWGLIPLYFAQILHIPPQEILAHRIVWSLGIMFFLTAMTKNVEAARRRFEISRLMMVLTLSAVLLAGNWLLYIYATVNNRVSEASLGYYMMPLVNAFLGSVFLKEKLRPLHYPALLCVVIGLAMPVLAGESFTWLAVVLPITFGCYGCVRKAAPVDSLTGLSVETLILSIPSTIFLIWLQWLGTGHLFNQTTVDGVTAIAWHDTLWLMFGGIATVVPLLTYTLSIRRLPLIAVSFIQFLSPTIQMILSVFVLHEDVKWGRWAAVGCVLVAVVIFLADAVLAGREKKRIVKQRNAATPVLSVVAS